MIIDYVFQEVYDPLQDKENGKQTLLTSDHSPSPSADDIQLMQEVDTLKKKIAEADEEVTKLSRRYQEILTYFALKIAKPLSWNRFLWVFKIVSKGSYPLIVLLSIHCLIAI